MNNAIKYKAGDEVVQKCRKNMAAQTLRSVGHNAHMNEWDFHWNPEVFIPVENISPNINIDLLLDIIGVM